MASLISKFNVTKDEWTLVASGKTTLAVQRSGSQPVEIVVLTAGSSAPTALDGTVNAYVLYDGFTSLNWEGGEAVDVYARARDVPSQVRVLAIGAMEPVIGAFSANGDSAVFTPAAGRAFNVSLWGTFSASVRLVRSFDGGTTFLPLTADGNGLMIFTAPVSEQWSEPETGVSYRLECSGFVSGTVNYRMSQ